MNNNKQGDTNVGDTNVGDNLPNDKLPTKVKRLTKRKKDLSSIIKPILKTYNPLISVVLLILMIVLVAVAPDAVLLDLIVILKGVIQLLTLATL